MASVLKNMTMHKYVKPVSEITGDIGHFFLDFLIPIIILLLVYFLVFAIVYTIKDHKRNKNDLLVENKNLFLVFITGIGKAFLKLLIQLPRILVVLVILFGLNLILSITGELTQFVDNQKKIEELSLVVKNLSRSDTIASFTINEKRSYTNQKKEMFVIFKVLSPDGDVVSTQNLEVDGDEIWIDFINLNFEYSVIESGKMMNIAYPYRVYSENLASSDAVPLTCVFNNENIPVLYLLKDSDIYGISPDDYFKRLQELFAIVNDPKACRETGIRSFQGNALHVRPEKGETYTIRVEGNGGLSLHKELF